MQHIITNSAQSLMNIQTSSENNNSNKKSIKNYQFDIDENSNEYEILKLENDKL